MLSVEKILTVLSINTTITSIGCAGGAPVPVYRPVITHKDWLQGLLCPHSRVVGNLIGCFS